MRIFSLFLFLGAFFNIFLFYGGVLFIVPKRNFQWEISFPR